MQKNRMKKRPIRREITFFAKVSKMAIFGKVAKGGPRENFQKWPIFWSNFGRLKKIGNTSRPDSLISMD